MSIHAEHRRSKRTVGPTHGLLSRLSRGQLADLLAPARRSTYAGGSIVLLRWCVICAAWMREGSAAAGRCVDCGAPRPD